jgi:hypothetical protein
VLLLAGALTALLALVAVASRGDRVTPSSGGGPSDALWDYVLSTYLVVGLAVFVGVMFLLIKDREALPTRRSRHLGVRQLFQLAVLVAVLFLVGPRLVQILRGGDEDERGAQTQTSDRDSDPKSRDDPAAQRDPRFRWAPVIALGTLGLISLALLASRRARRRDELDEQEMADALAAVLDDALADLRAERDPRRAIIAAYARMERLLAVHGVPRDPAEAPFEYLARVLVELHASASSVFELTALFERAKFSSHAVDSAMKDEALAALVAVRDELRPPE